MLLFSVLFFVYNILKGDKMKKVKLIFKNVELKKNNQVYVKIYDNRCNLVYEGYTFDGEIDISLRKDRAYNMIAKFYNNSIVTVFYVGNGFNKYIFNFNYINNENNNVTFLLTDFYYTNLPIERGDIILWQR